MEEYTLGSISDIIRGKNVQNKPKIKKTSIVSLNLNSEKNNDSEKKIELDINSNNNVELNNSHKSISNNIQPGKPSKKTKTSSVSHKKIKKTKTKNIEIENEERIKCTIFVGNLPITCTKIHLKRLFSKHGNVESARIRGISVNNLKVPKKVAIMKKQFHPDRNSIHGFVRFKTNEEAVKASTETNGLLYKDHHLRVRLCNTQKHDESRAIFVGNLHFNTEEEELWKQFECCGPISDIRIIRDSKTGIGKGFGYVNFEHPDSVQLALELENIKVKNRILRISCCNIGTSKKNKIKNKVKKIKKPGKIKESKQNTSLSENKHDKQKIYENKDVMNNTNFQGSKFTDKKNKKRVNKGLLQKKKMIKKVAPKAKN